MSNRLSRIEAGLDSNYSLDMKTRVLNRRTNLGRMYLENMYIMAMSKLKAKATWFRKKNGTSCGMS